MLAAAEVRGLADRAATVARAETRSPWRCDTVNRCPASPSRGHLRGLRLEHRKIIW